MLVVEKTRHINAEFYGEGIADIAKILKREIPSIKIINNDNELEEVTKTNWFKNLKASITPGENLKARRTIAQLTQKQLAEKTGIAASHISAMENGRRTIGLASARTLAKALDCNISELIAYPPPASVHCLCSLT